MRYILSDFVDLSHPVCLRAEHAAVNHIAGTARADQAAQWLHLKSR